MYVKNNSSRVITLTFKSKSVKVIPTLTAKITDDQVKEIEASKVMSSWFKDRDLSEVKEKALLNDTIVNASSMEQLDANYNIRELQSYAKETQVEGYSNLDKSGLITLLKQ